jgi:ribosome-associated protein
MEEDLPIKNGIVISGHEIEVTASRAGGPGGQHVNKTSTRITLRWNAQHTTALSNEQKERVLQKLAHRLTTTGDLIIHHAASRSQEQNKKMARHRLAEEIRKALHVPKKRMATRISRATKEKRLQEKTHRGAIKNMRRKAFDQD